MILKNLTTHKVICKDLKICESFWDRMLGLLIPENPRNLMFRTRFGIHTFFLKEPIDVLVLDSHFRVVRIKEGLKPNRLFFWNPLFPIVLELKQGLIKKFRFKKNQVVEIY